MKKKSWLLLALASAAALTFTAGCGEALKPSGVDEGNFGGSGNDETNVLVTDKFVSVDGKLDEECWQGQKTFDYTYENVRVRVTTVFGDLGFYVGYTVSDTHVYACETRPVWMGSSVEIYVDRGDATKKTEQTFQYRLGALDQWECLYGYETIEDKWSAKWLPVYGRTQVQGTVNSGQTEGLTAEIFVRWDALGYDYAAADFIVPQSVKIMPVYNQSSGAELSSQRDFWVNNGGDHANPMHYWLFDKNGYTDEDGQGATIGDSSYGRAKTPGWDISKEGEGIVKSDLAGDQSIFFKDIYAPEYAVTTLIDFESALKYWASDTFWTNDPYPKAGLILASDDTLEAFLLDYDARHRVGDAEGMFFRKGNPDPREVWQLYGTRSLKDICDASKPVRLTGVKYGRYLLMFVGDENAPKYGGTFVGMQEVSALAGNAAPGFYALGCAVSYTDYAVTTDRAVIDHMVEGVLSVLTLEQKAGGALECERYGYTYGSAAKVTVKTYEGYALTSLKVNGEEKISQLSKEGVLSVAMNEDRVNVVPVFTRAESTSRITGTLVYAVKNAYATDVVLSVAGECTGGGYVYLETTPSAPVNDEGEYAFTLPNGVYSVTVTVDGIDKVQKEITVNGADLSLGKTEVPLNWVFEGGVTVNKNGAVTVTGFNQFRAVKGVSATDFAMNAYLYRADGKFDQEGSWETGGFGIKVANTVYRIYTMRENANTVVVYLGIDGGATQEYRVTGSYAGTGAPQTVQLVYLNGEIHLLLDGTMHVALNRENTSDSRLHPLFDAAAEKSFGFVTVGKDMVFENYDFKTGKENAQKALAAMQYTIRLPQGISGLSVTATVGTAFYGDTVTVTVHLEEGYRLTQFSVNGQDMRGMLENGKLYLRITENIVITAQTKEVPVYAVSGTYGYASGLFTQGDTVTVSSEEFTGTAQNGAWSLSLPDGTHTVTLASDRFVSVTCQVTVNGGAQTVAQALTFTQIAFEGTNHTQNGADLSITAGVWKTAYFAGVNASSAAYVKTHLQRADGNFSVEGTWGTGGFAISKGGVDFFLYVMRLNASEVCVYLNNRSNFRVCEFSHIRYPYAGTGAPIDLELAYLGDSLYLMIGGARVFELNAEKLAANGLTGGDYAVYRDLLFNRSAGEWKIGFALMDLNCDVQFSDFGYFLEDAAEEKFRAAMVSEVLLPQATEHIRVTADKTTAYVGETVTLTVTLGESCRLTKFRVNGKDVTPVGGKFSVTVTTGGTITVEAEAEQVLMYTVSGVFDYASGLYGDGDTVTVSSGEFTGTVDGDGWTIELPNGTHTVTLTSARFSDITCSVTVNGGDLSVSEAPAFSEIKFTEDSVYERNGEDIITPTSAWTPAYFAGINGANGIRIDTELQREDGNYGEGGWGTGGYAIEKNGVVYLIFVMNAAGGEGFVYLQNKSNWTTYEYRGIPAGVNKTGAPLRLSLVYLGDSLHLQFNGKTVFSLTAENYASRAEGTPDPAVYAQLFKKGENDRVKVGFATMDTGGQSGIRYKNFGYTAVKTLPESFQTAEKSIFASNSVGGTVTYPNGSAGICPGEKWLGAGDGSFLTSGGSGDFMIGYSIERLDGKFDVEGTWESLGLAVYANNQSYRLFLMRESAASAIFYLQNNSANTSSEYHVQYAYAGTGAPLTLTVAYTSADETLHVKLGETHFTLALREGQSLESLYANNAKILGFFANVAGSVSNISYEFDAEAVSQAVSAWGAAQDITN